MTRLALIFALIASSVSADPAVVTGVASAKTGGTYTFNVTLKHPDTGWDHYADGWRILDANGTVLGTRELLHPHVDEQPFTRSLSGVKIPEGVTSVLIQTRDNVSGWSDKMHRHTLN